MIKRILVPLDPSPFSKAALDWAMFMARRHDAELAGLVILDFPGIRKSTGPVPLGGSFYAGRLQESRAEEATKRINTLLARFVEKCDKERVAHSENRRQGIPSRWILKESIYYDAVVMGMRTHFRFGTGEKHGDSLEKVLDHSITPIYCVPQNVRLPEGPDRKMTALILFNGSLPSGHALQRFAQLAVPERSDVVLLISHEEREEALGLLDQAEAYLRRHSFERIQKKWTDDNIIKALESGYPDGIDLIVVGAHSQKGLYKFKLGGVPRHLIKAANTPLLLG
jgi:nucleotide-binding universal stress UspA family protein